MRDFVLYLRTSTDDQKLGIEAQRAKATNFVNASGGRIIAEYCEHESGKDDGRAELAKAIEDCEFHGATLLIAKLDRLSRSVAFLFSLKERLDRLGLKAVAIDFPEVMNSTFLLGVLGSLAQQERELISERTKAALAVKKAQGVKLGRPKGADLSKAQAAAASSNRQKADTWAQDNLPVIESLYKLGASLNSIAKTLNADGRQTRRGGKWTSTTVKRVLKRCMQ